MTAFCGICNEQEKMLFAGSLVYKWRERRAVPSLPQNAPFPPFSVHECGVFTTRPMTRGWYSTGCWFRSVCSYQTRLEVGIPGAQTVSVDL